CLRDQRVDPAMRRKNGQNRRRRNAKDASRRRRSPNEVKSRSNPKNLQNLMELRSPSDSKPVQAKAGPGREPSRKNRKKKAIRKLPDGKFGRARSTLGGLKRSQREENTPIHPPSHRLHPLPHR